MNYTTKIKHSLIKAVNVTQTIYKHCTLITHCFPTEKIKEICFFTKTLNKIVFLQRHF